MECHCFSSIEHCLFISMVKIMMITGWAVALSCYISHSTKHRKMTEFNPSGSQNPLTDFDETWHG